MKSIKYRIINEDYSISLTLTEVLNKIVEKSCDEQLINLIQKEKDLFNGKVPNIDYDYAQTIHGVHNFGDKYNIFQFHNASIHKLFKALRDMTIEACQYYGIDFDSQTYMIQGWFNINYTKKGKLDWHDHGPIGAPNFHGYYCVSAEPSITHYRVYGKDVENHNKNNRLILSEMSHPHAMGDWSWDGPRITVAYDVLPLKDLMSFGSHQEQHWIPLC